MCVVVMVGRRCRPVGPMRSMTYAQLGHHFQSSPFWAGLISAEAKLRKGLGNRRGHGFLSPEQYLFCFVFPDSFLNILHVNTPTLDL